MGYSDARFHTTKAEKKFIDGLGSFHAEVFTSRLVLLRMYLHTMPMRVRWGDINKDKIRSYVIASIQTEEDRVMKHLFN